MPSIFRVDILEAGRVSGGMLFYSILFDIFRSWSRCFALGWTDLTANVSIFGHRTAACDQVGGSQYLCSMFHNFCMVQV